MAMISTKKVLKELSLGFLAIFLIGLGVSIYIKCQIGSDGLTVFLDGLNKFFGISISLADQCITLILLTLAYFMNKENIGVFTILNALLIGSCIALAEIIIKTIPFDEMSLYFKIIAVIFAQIIMSTGSAMLQCMSLGKSIYDAFILGISEKLKVSYKVAFIIYGASFMAVGLIFGGKIGIGTAISILLGGIFTSYIKELLMNYELY